MLKENFAKDYMVFVKKNPNRPNYFFDFPIIGSKIKVVVDLSSDLSKQARKRHWPMKKTRVQSDLPVWRKI